MIDNLHDAIVEILTNSGLVGGWYNRRLGVLIEEPEGSYLAETDTNGALRSLQAASCTSRFALGPRAGQKVLSLQSLPSRTMPSTPELRVNAHGLASMRRKARLKIISIHTGDDENCVYATAHP
jgi:hypothetical protein